MERVGEELPRVLFSAATSEEAIRVHLKWGEEEETCSFNVFLVGQLGVGVEAEASGEQKEGLLHALGAEEDRRSRFLIVG